MTLNDRQVAFLRVLADKQNFAGLRPTAGLNPVYIYNLAYPDEPYRGRRDAGATRTLDGLEKLGLVHSFYPSVNATGRCWKITAAGRARLAEQTAAEVT